MRRNRRRALTGLALLACVVVVPPARAADERRCAEAGDAFPIVERREAFNVAIRDGDLSTIEAILTDDVVLVAGTHSDLFLDREAQLDIWRSEFEKGSDRLIYLRTPECVERSDIAPMALEYRHWRGAGPGDDFAAGRYTAKWREVDGAWRLEAEVFMTTSCGGGACPD